MTTNDELVSQSRMLTATQVASMLAISKQNLWRLSNAKNENKRIPSYKIGGKRLYKYDEIMWFVDKNKTLPNEAPSGRWNRV